MTHVTYSLFLNIKQFLTKKFTFDYNYTNT